ncbi:TetR/AcrR family transcriptional regulator [Saccharibacillus brassicae]|uniref:TetR/AcrR family transcriptional regulator n=1 Tax=Saccharibacillus brassicae TaxID=2583377 RepID=A0A4Y6UWF4_SACBS|nr:TetR/AcrR family transcriptional regulator [Saccharibacillus brassicae]QDH22062.1 TetR/AcrR family transcriptional regulator [Saccharibacillus brassicae]
MRKTSVPARPAQPNQIRMNHILDTATGLLIEKPNASLNEIAQQAGIGIATLHRYVESREQLMVRLGFRAIEVVRTAIAGVAFDEEQAERYVTDLIEALVPLGDKVHFLVHDASVNENPEIEQAYEKLRQPVMEAFERLRERGVFRAELQPEWMWGTAYSLLFLAWEQIRAGVLAPRAAVSLVADTLCRGLGPDRRR